MMTFRALEKVLAVILVALAIGFLVINIPSNPQLVDWILPVLFGVIGVFWLIAYEGREHQHK